MVTQLVNLGQPFRSGAHDSRWVIMDSLIQPKIMDGNGSTATTGQETTFSGAEAQTIAHTNAANAVFNICDISSEPDKVELLVNVDFSVAIPSCAYTPPIVNSGGAWSCNGNGKGGNLLKFTVKNTGTVVAVRDAAVSDVLRSYGDAISTHDVGGVKGKGFCDASYLHWDCCDCLFCLTA
ncbi:hypothetical protein CLAFUW4_04623 [Fulvia fulva]|uniref:Uncharacterized protein n=1 Tax=Passalora fulva TaxID=5499 RepID=A0A9Q8LE85_PASFU|nr:uncharacterized protein CLAFUR5_04583 [Fulvia fulva]KAK4626743.1 hypothetical protein CLAFUR4_04609 [Fulvia fulva]KAK4627850.1 hypothetical protein CLAFUR0_04611 [Fulvia fulva]UJO15769.1 hypothetical protein CLAFUR5_04583 [Fulvia fulva]WPV13479.1 hypothetical protein CLAFUW4_04623 [Fulvia fulva]WPV28417.1 hypothetical protein CLAFUW7_04615 [Fulvia fulva]